MKVDLPAIAAFYVIACGLGWLASAPLWFSHGGATGLTAQIWLGAMMFSPGIATAVMVFGLRRGPSWGDIRTETGLRLGHDWKPYWAFGWLMVPAFCLAAPFVGALLGLYPLDLQHFSGYRALLEEAGATEQMQQIPITFLVMAQLFNVLLTPLLNFLPALGEEWGWRGWLLPRLLPLGQWPALVISGVMWGLWHAPVIYLGHNYPQHPLLGIVAMVGLCIVFGILLGWTRLATNSVFPAVIAHGALNGSAGFMMLFHAADPGFDTLHAGITGWSGWILPLAFIAVLVATGRLPTPIEET